MAAQPRRSGRHRAGVGLILDVPTGHRIWYAIAVDRLSGGQPDTSSDDLLSSNRYAKPSFDDDRG